MQPRMGDHRASSSGSSFHPGFEWRSGRTTWSGHHRSVPLPKGRGPLRRNRAARPDDSRQSYQWSFPTVRSGWRRSNLDRRGPDALSERQLTDKLLAGCRPGIRNVESFSPLLPAFDESLAYRVTSFAEARACIGAGSHDGVGEPERKRTLRCWQLAEQGYVAVNGFAVFPGHSPVPGKILPSVGSSHVSCTRPGKAAVAEQAQCGRLLPSRQIACRASVVVFAAIAEMRCQQRVERHIVASETIRDENYVSARVRNHFDHQPIAVALVRDLR